MKEIIINSEKYGKRVCLVDDCDFTELSKYNWHIIKQGINFYVARHQILNGKKKLILMHRSIMNTPINMQTDHKDHNGLNNQRGNLRICTVSQNQMNCKASGKSKYIGVSFVDRPSGRMIRAEITVNNKRLRLGYFKTEEDAAYARDLFAKVFHSEFANLNFKDGMRSQFYSSVREILIEYEERYSQRDVAEDTVDDYLKQKGMNNVDKK